MTIISIKGSCNPKTRIGSYHVSVNGNHFSGTATDTTVNRMELTALIEGIKMLKTNKERATVHIVANSNYIPNGMHQFREYQKRNFYTTGGAKVANLDLWNELIIQAKKKNIFIEANTMTRP